MSDENWRITGLVSGALPFFDPCCFPVFINGERKLGRLVDALALGGDEGRDKLR